MLIKFNWIFFLDMSSKSRIDDCKCQCLPHMNTYREDLGICVDDIHGKFFFCFVY